jgi:signal transduction histidine kinase
MDLPRPAQPAESEEPPDRLLVVDVLHELRSPLTVVGGQVFQLKQQLKRGDADPVQLAAKLDEIARATNRMAAALDELAARAACALIPVRSRQRRPAETHRPRRRAS